MQKRISKDKIMVFINKQYKNGRKSTEKVKGLLKKDVL